MNQVTELDFYIRERELRQRVPISHATIWRMVNAGSFPAPIKLAPRVTVWKWADVASWIEERRSSAA